MRALVINDGFVIHFYWHYWEVLETFGYWAWLEKVGSLEIADSLSWSLHFLSLPLMPEVRHLGLLFGYDAFCIITSHRQWIQSPSHRSQHTQHTYSQISVRVFPKSTCGHVEHTGLQDAREGCWRHCGHIHHEAALSPCSPPLSLDQRLDSRMKHMD